jgi:hypothetical protein
VADPQPLDADVVCGLLTERGEHARGQTYERRWERDHAVWRAVLGSLEDAARGAQPSTPAPRPPSWLAPLVRAQLQAMSTRWFQHSAFEPVRALERLGLVGLDADDTYVLAAVSGLGDRRDVSRAASLRSDPDLVERAVWRMFEVEGGGEVSLANVDKYSAEAAGWQATFVELVDDGTLPRERVLTSALGALNRDFSAYRAGWYARLYDALEPTVEELSRHQPQLRTLLRSTVTATVGFAVDKLRALDKSGLLDGAETLKALGPAVVTGPKTTAAAAVRLAETITKRSPGLAPETALVARSALGHPHADVQRVAATLLRKVASDEELDRAADHLEPSVRVDVLGQRPATVSEPRSTLPSAGPLNPSVAPTTRDDLLDRLAALLEDASDSLEVELVLDGLARLDDHEVLRPLRKRAATILRRGPREGVTRAWVRGLLARLVLGAGGDPTPNTPTAPDHSVAFLLRRSRAVEDVLRGQRPPMALIATPDHAQGWLSGTKLVERLQGQATRPDPHDLVAALLRLHPEGRSAAIDAAEDERGALSGSVAAVVRYALGAPPPPAPRRRLTRAPKLETVPWWIAASRARSPGDTDDWLAAHGVTGAGRSQPIEASVTFQGQPFSWSDSRGKHESMSWRWTVDVMGAPKRASDEEPTAALTREGISFGTDELEDLVGWAAVTYPHDCEQFLLTGVDPVIRAATTTEVSHDAVRVLRAVARHPGRLGSLAAVTLAAGLTASKADQRAHAVDAVVQQHEAGRLDATQLADGLSRFAGPATLTRWASSMKDLAASGPGARDLVIDALGSAMPRTESAARGMHALLELLREELLRAGRPAPAAMRQWLGQFRGASRAAKAAAALLALG